MTSKIGKNLEKIKNSGKVAFLKNKDDIKEAIQEGWSAKDIWRDLKEKKKLDFSYQMFMRYTSKYIKNETDIKVVASAKQDDLPTTKKTPKMVKTETNIFNYKSDSKSEKDLY